MIEVGRNSIIVRGVDKKSSSYTNARYKYSLYDKVQHKYTFSAYYENGNDLYFPSSVTVLTLKLFLAFHIMLHYF